MTVLFLKYLLARLATMPIITVERKCVSFSGITYDYYPLL
jgi:hypothetical protein